MAPLAWVKRITAELPELKTIPLFGNAPPFDWHRLSSLLKGSFGISQVHISPKEQSLREPGEIKKGFGTNPSLVPITIAPLGTVLWMMRAEDVEKLATSLMKSGGKTRPLSSEILQEGFYRFLILQALHDLQPLPPFTKFTLLLSEEEVEETASFCIDVDIEIDERNCWGRLVIPADFRTRWIQHFSQMASEYIPTELAKETFIQLALKIGSCQLTQEEWNSIAEGDFLPLGQGSYDLQKQTVSGMLMLQSAPLFNVKISQNKVELVDYAFYYEENMEEKKEELVSLKELPLQVTVEIGRLKMTLDQLMQLNPGNLLDLPVHPDQGVSLTVNGHSIGRAELIYLGEQLGLRILEMG